MCSILLQNPRLESSAKTTFGHRAFALSNARLESCQREKKIVATKVSKWWLRSFVTRFTCAGLKLTFWTINMLMWNKMSFFSSDLTPTDWILSKWKKLRVRCVRIKVSGQLWQLHNASHLKESIDVAFFYRFIFTSSVFVMAWLSSLTSCSQVFICGAIAFLAWLLFMCCLFQCVSRMITCPSIRPTLVTSHSLTGSSVDRGGKIRESLRKSLSRTFRVIGVFHWCEKIIWNSMPQVIKSLICQF